MFGCPLGPAHRVPGLWERKVRRKDSSVSGPVLFSDVDGLRGAGERGPRPGDVGGRSLAGSLGQCLCSTSWAVGLPSLARICWVSAA